MRHREKEKRNNFVEKIKEEKGREDRIEEREWHKRGRQAQRDMKVSLSEWLRSET